MTLAKIRNFVLAFTLATIAFPNASSAQDGFKSLFNGNDLTGWDGNPALWSVEDGCITGKTTGPETLAYNQFLIWRGGVLKNFELHAKVKQAGNNTGIQYRSKEFSDVGKWSVGGYQCDIHPSAPNNAMVYGEKWGGILVQNGQSVVIDPDGKRWLVAEREPVKVDVAEWHEYTIIAQGNHLVHKIDGQVTIDLLDYGPKTQALEGLLAFQLHRGPAMQVQIKDVMLKELPASSMTAFDKTTIPANAKSAEKEKGIPKEKAKKKPNDEVKTSTSSVLTDELKWVWSDSSLAKEGARLKKQFELGEVAASEASLHVTCDNGAKVFLNGVLVLTNPDWQKPTRADVKKHLRVGKNELLVEATNKGSVGAFIGSLHIRRADGTEQSILSDGSWMAAVPGTEDWKPVRVMASYGSKPWGDVFKLSGDSKATETTKTDGKAKQKRAASTEPSEVVQPADIHAPPGFQVELIHTVSKADEGSWVGLTVDDQGRLIASDQYGSLYRVTPPSIGSKEAAKVEKLEAEISGAHGLLYAFDSLYVMVNEEPDKAGLWRLRDTKGTGQFDEKILLREVKGRREHGNHSLTLSPDGKSIYIACGNATEQPPLEHTRGSRPFADDQVIPRTSKGSAFSDNEPQAFTCKVSPDGKHFEMVVAGLRNHFDIAFNALGDLFTYDSDMEWDAGTPWYRPTRIYHLISGGDYGFRESSGKLHEYCPDVVPPLINVGPGSPTGVVSGLGSKFPAKYQHAIFASDWTYGTLYAVHLTPEGAGYNAKLEEFITAKPLPLTDVVISKDGAMYFSIGGRRTQSALYRVTYAGEESTAPAATPIETPEHKLRVELDRLHDEGTGPEAIDKAWPYLGHPDRLVRWAARVAIERQPASLWASRALKQIDPTFRAAFGARDNSVPFDPSWAAIESAVAVARMGGKEHQNDFMTLLNRIDFSTLSLSQQLALVRAYEISIARYGLPAGESLTQTIVRLDKVYPAKTNDLNTELSRTLVALGSTNVVEKTIHLMTTARDEEVSWLSTERLERNDRYGPKFLRTGESRPNVQQIAYAYALRMAKTGWTPELRQTFFAWFASTAPWEGGNQFRGFLNQIRDDALATVADVKERDSLRILATPAQSTSPLETVPPPKGPGKSYTVDEVVALTKDELHSRNFKRGRELYIGAQCQACHRLGNDGGGVGPDLTRSANRYTVRDLLENIITPSKVISDQYESTLIELNDGTVITGRITSEQNDTLFIVTNPAKTNEITEVKTSDIENRKASPVSLMPADLVNTMNPTELKDLIAYILSAGDPKHPMFKR